MVPPPRLPERGRMAALYGWLNQLLAYAESLRPVQSLNTLTSHTAIGTTRHGLGEAVTEEGGATIQRFTISAVFDDFVSARKTLADGSLDTSDTTTYYIAKPRHLRRSLYHNNTIGDWSFSVSTDGQTRTRTYVGATVAGSFQAGDRFAESLYPQYAQLDDIYATEPEGETGVVVDNDLLSVDGERLTWQDLNVDARHFRPNPVRLTVCVNNVTRGIVVEGGPLI